MKIIDLTQGFYLGLKPYPADWYPAFDIQKVMEPSNDPNGTTRTFTQHHIFPHNATHIESSLHFFPDGTPIQNVPLETLVGEALVADLSEKGEREPVKGRDLEKAVGDIIVPKSRLLIRTDYLNNNWEKEGYWENPPFLTTSAVNWMIEKQVLLVGMDCLTEEPGDKDSPVHTQLLKNEIPIIEYLKNLCQLKSRKVFLVALPMSVEGVEAAAARVIAIEGEVLR